MNIYFPENLTINDREGIVNACGELMEALGFEMKAEEEPIFNSFWQRIGFIFKKNLTPDDLDRVFRKGKQALENKHVDLPIAEQTLKLAEAAEKINNIMEKYPTGCIRLGALLVIKRTVDGESKIKVFQLNSDLIEKLDHDPEYIKKIDELAERLSPSVGPLTMESFIGEEPLISAPGDTNVSPPDPAP